MALKHAPKCKAKSKRTGKRCTQVAMQNGCCRYHGGKTPSSVASVHFKHGNRQKTRYDRFLDNLGLTELAETALTGVDLHSSDDAMFLMELRVFSLLEHGLGVEWARSLLEAWERLKEANRSKDETASRQAFIVVDELITQGCSNEKRWEEIVDLEERIDKIRDRAHKRAVDAQLLIRVDIAMGILTGLIYGAKDVVRSILEEAHRPDLAPKAITALTNQFIKLTGRTRAELPDGRGGQATDINGDHSGG